MLEYQVRLGHFQEEIMALGTDCSIGLWRIRRMHLQMFFHDFPSLDPFMKSLYLLEFLYTIFLQFLIDTHSLQFFLLNKRKKLKILICFLSFCTIQLHHWVATNLDLRKHETNV